MSDQVSNAASALFPENGRPVRDIKFFDINQRGITAAALAEQVNRAEASIRFGTAQRVENVDTYLTS